MVLGRGDGDQAAIAARLERVDHAQRRVSSIVAHVRVKNEQDGFAFGRRRRRTGKQCGRVAMMMSGFMSFSPLTAGSAEPTNGTPAASERRAARFLQVVLSIENSASAASGRAHRHLGTVVTGRQMIGVGWSSRRRRIIGPISRRNSRMARRAPGAMRLPSAKGRSVDCGAQEAPAARYPFLKEGLAGHSDGSWRTRREEAARWPAGDRGSKCPAGPGARRWPVPAARRCRVAALAPPALSM